MSNLPAGLQAEIARGPGGGAKKKDETPGAAVQRKASDGAAIGATDPAAVKDQLGSGEALEGRVQARMSSAFGYDFSRVRVHTDAKAGELSGQLNARAFTIGSDVAFAGGEYQPGTLIGDTLIAHELAHVVQQGNGGSAIARAHAEDSQDQFERDADQSALAATLSFAGTTNRISRSIANIKPRLKSGLQLQACRRTVKECPRGLRWAVVGLPAATGPVCVCAWRCLPPGVGYSVYSDYSGPVESTIDCADKDAYGRCPGAPDYKTVDEDYEKREQGTVVGVGAHMSPLGGEAACGCLPLDIEGDATGQQSVHAPLLPPGVDVTDVLAPLGDVAAARRGAKPQVDPTTGTIHPDKETTKTENRPDVEGAHPAKPATPEDVTAKPQGQQGPSKTADVPNTQPDTKETKTETQGDVQGKDEAQPKPTQAEKDPAKGGTPPAGGAPAIDKAARLEQIKQERAANDAKIQDLNDKIKAADDRTREAGEAGASARGDERTRLQEKARRNAETRDRLSEERGKLNRRNAELTTEQANLVRPPAPPPTTWQEAEGSLRTEFSGQKKTFKLPDLGERDVDCYTAADNTAREGKFGGPHDYKGHIVAQVAKDRALLKSGQVASVEWHFYKDPKGGSGLTARLRKELTDAGIKIVPHF